ncbi:MAG: helix-turn-helix transcriptional regulator [Clostridia bacterium]|nr:helix-turn-helix transcriptional regulator [Clostridia bacterium]
MKTLAQYRADRNLKQGEVAKKLKVGQSTVATWEAGLAYPRPQMLLKLAKILGIDVADVINSIM